MVGINRKTLLKNAAAVALIFAAAFAGVQLGKGFRAHRMQESTPPLSPETPASKLDDGRVFPDVALQATDGTGMTTKSLLANRGGVVLFLELGCPPCKEMCERWQQFIDAKQLGDIPLWGVTFSPLAEIEPYKAANKLSFPIYCDTGRVFMSQYALSSYPMALIVGRSGVVEWHSYNALDKIDLKQVAEQLSQ
ncbi:MAG TPA: redoxin domain-containing protein [Candidatus Acidoferrum sp.]|nr:redoxin domain-containing protein [Candidatus Acidoferrum sp.]